MKKKFHCGINIRKFRRQLGITQTELGDKIGKTQALVSYIEKTGIVNKGLIIEIANELNIPQEVLLYENENEAISSFSTNLKKDKIYIQMQSEIDYLKQTIEDLKSIIDNLSKR
jgi:transcriptional regulator with XRE-family HTH domain